MDVGCFVVVYVYDVLLVEWVMLDEFVDMDVGIMGYMVFGIWGSMVVVLFVLVVKMVY